jgi:hypothetical protein
VASALARERGAELSAFEAVSEPIYVNDPVSGQWALEARLEKAQKQLAELPGVKPHVASGDEAQALARYAASVDLRRRFPRVPAERPVLGGQHVPATGGRRCVPAARARAGNPGRGSIALAGCARDFAPGVQLLP